MEMRDESHLCSSSFLLYFQIQKARCPYSTGGVFLLMFKAKISIYQVNPESQRGGRVPAAEGRREGTKIHLAMKTTARMG